MRLPTGRAEAGKADRGRRVRSGYMMGASSEEHAGCAVRE